MDGMDICIEFVSDGAGIFYGMPCGGGQVGGKQNFFNVHNHGSGDSQCFIRGVPSGIGFGFYRLGGPNITWMNLTYQAAD